MPTASPRASPVCSSSAISSTPKPWGPVSAIRRRPCSTVFCDSTSSAPSGRTTPRPEIGNEHAQRLRKLLLAVVDDVLVLIVQIALTLHRLRNGARPTWARASERLAREGLETLRAARESPRHLAVQVGNRRPGHSATSDPASYKSIAGQLNERRVDRERFIEDARASGRRGTAANRDTGGGDRPREAHSQHMAEDAAQVAQCRAGGDRTAVRPEGHPRAGGHRRRVLTPHWVRCTACGRTFRESSTTTSPTPSRTATARCTRRSSAPGAGIWKSRSARARCTTRPSSVWPRTGDTRKDPAARSPVRTSASHRCARSSKAREEADEPGSILTSIGRELESERVYAFTPRGDIVDLPAGSTPLDFAYQIHTQVGHRCRGAKVNGRIVPLTYAVLLRRPHRGSHGPASAAEPRLAIPNLGYLGSSRSRAKVRHWFKHQDRERNVADGQDIWDREVKRLGARNPPRDALAERFNAQRFEDFLAALGRGDVSVPQLAGALQPYLPAPRHRSRRCPGGGGSGPATFASAASGDLLTQMASAASRSPTTRSWATSRGDGA